MTQIIVTLENNADSFLVQQMIENMKGVIKTTLRRHVSNTVDTEREEWLSKVRSLGGSVNPAIVDMTDDRTKYIMSK